MGNTTAIGSTKSMGWDVLNRMTSFTSGSTTTDYAYRADGMRVSKASGTQAVTYGYDGQMQVEECFADSGAPSTDYTTRYGLGTRGIDRVETTNGSGTSVGYPVYDSHGNMIATLAESGSSYSLGNQRSYDAWGGVRSGSTTGGPSPRHCASLGHVQDDESGLVYMRARYYEASSSRFVSEDAGQQYDNWYIYCGNLPTERADPSGTMWDLWAGMGPLFDQLLKLCTAGGSAARKIRALQILLRKFEDLTRINRIISGIEMSDAEADAEIAPFAGQFSVLQARIAELKESFAVYGFAEGAVMRLTMASIRALIVLLQEDL